MSAWTPAEMMAVASSRALEPDDVCLVGIGAPSAACNLARLTRCPDITLIYESGTIGARPDVLPLSIADGMLAETALVTVSVPEMFAYWLQGGHVTVGFLGAAQMDRYGNIGTTVVGAYASPTVRLPGSGGAPEIATQCGRTLITARHSRRAMVEQVDFITSLGFGPTGRERAAAGIPTAGPVRVITDLCQMQPPGEDNELVVTSLHPGVTREEVRAATGWSVRFAEEVEEEAPPTDEELTVLRKIQSVV